MDTLSAFAMGEASRGNTSKVFDWDKAARLIKEHGATTAVAGLSTDMEYTAGLIYNDNKIFRDGYTYLASTWATPVIILDGGEEIPCYIMNTEEENPNTWGAGTCWPESAVKILEK